MVAAQVQPRLLHGQHRIDRVLPCVVPPAAGAGTRLVAYDERPRSFVRHQDVHAAKTLARLDFLAHEMPPLIRQLRRLRAALLRMRQGGGGRLVPRGRERAAQPRHAQRPDPHRRAVRNEMKVRDGARASLELGDAIEVLVVPLDPVQRFHRLGVDAAAAREIADAQPERYLRVPFHDSPRRWKVAVDIAERADHELTAWSRPGAEWFAQAPGDRACPR